MDVQLFQACNDEADIFLATQFFEFYHKWQNSAYHTHLGIYFNIQIKKYVFINDSRKHQHAIVPFLANDEPRGYRKIYIAGLRDKIRYIRSNVPFYQL